MKLYKKFKGDQLPQAALDWAAKNDIFKSGHAYWAEAHYKGPNPETAEDWVIVTSDGWYYKVGAICMTWYKSSITGDIVGKANWSVAALRRTIKAVCNEQIPPHDPNYQT